MESRNTYIKIYVNFKILTFVYIVKYVFRTSVLVTNRPWSWMDNKNGLLCWYLHRYYVGSKT